MYNPDYPNTENAGFIQHTYQAQQQNNDMFYVNGQAVYNPFAPTGYQSDSRRAINPVNPYGVYPNPNQPMNGYNPQNQAIPESQVQPFSSYPPSTPLGNVPNMGGLNSLVDSRRNFDNTLPQNNPWITQNPAPTYTQPQNNFNNNGYGGNFNNGYPSTFGNVESNTLALYSSGSMGYNRKVGAWDNCYVQNRAIPMPVIDWRQQQQNQQNQQNQQVYSYQPNMQPQFPPQYQNTQANWAEIAVKNWSSNKL